MPQFKMKLEDAVRAVSQAIATVLKHSTNATFISTCLSRLQASSPAEAEHRVALHLWSILHRHQGASIPLEIAHELTMVPLCQEQLSVRLFTCRDDDATAEERQGSSQGNDSPADLFMDDGRDDLLFKLATSDLRMHSAGGTTAAHVAPQSQASPGASALNAQDAHTPVSPPLLQSHRPRGNGEQSLLSDDVLIAEQADKEGAAGPPSPDEDKEEILRGGIAHDSQELLQDVSALGSSWGSLSARVLCDPTPSEPSLQFSRLDCLEESQLMADFPPEEEEDFPAADGCGLESYCQSDSKERIDQALYLLSQTPTTSAQEEAYANTKRLMERALADLSECMAEDDPAARTNPWWCPLPSQQVEPQTPLPDMGNSSISLNATNGSESVSILRDLDARHEEDPLDVIGIHESDFEDNDHDSNRDFDEFNETETNLHSENGQEMNPGGILSARKETYDDDYEWDEAVCSDTRRAPLGSHAADTYGKSGDNQVAALPSASVATIENNKVVPAIKHTHTNFLDEASPDGRPGKEVRRGSRFEKSAFSTGMRDLSNEDNALEWQEGGTASSGASPRQLLESQVSEEEDSESLLNGVVFDSITGLPIERLPSQDPN